MSVNEAGVAGVEQRVNVEGWDHEVVVAGRDLFIETHVHTGVAEFVTLELASIPAHAAPRGAAALAGRLRQRSVLVLAGDDEDKPMVARHVAARLARTIAAAGGDAPALLEWAGSLELEALLRGLHARDTPAVVLLPSILPQQVDWNLARLYAAARERRHHVLATTDLRRERWHLEPGEEGFWHELTGDELYDSAALVTLLVEELARANGPLPDGLLRQAHEPARSALGGVALGDLAARLRTPANARRFGELLRNRADEEGAGVDVERLVDEATSARGRLMKWFNGELDSAQRVLALGLSFFAGLADDQCFAALERWVKHIRAERDPLQRAFDYADVAALEFFDRVETENGGARFEARLADQRRLVFEAAWGSHRRQLVGALGVLTGLAAQSAEHRGGDAELYGSAGRRWQVRRSVTETLSDLGVLSPAAVEPALLRLASDGDADVQAVAAAAVARWRGYGRDAQFFALVERWQRDARIGGVVEALLEGRDETRSRGAQAQIRATLAQAVGFAAAYDPPNRLVPALVALLESLARDRNRFVRRRFTEYTLPQVVRLHLVQLRPTLREMARRADLAHPIGVALAFAARTLPDEVAATLEAWHAEASAERPRVADPRRLDERDVLVMAVAYTCGELAYDAGGPPTPAHGFARLREILAREAHPRVRGAAIVAIGRQARTRFAVAEPMLQRLVAEIAPDEVDDVVRLLADVYLAQRREMKGGDDTFEVKGERVPIWIDRPRPLTAVEMALLRWLGDAAHPAAQRIAMLATLAFVEMLDGPESNEVARRREARWREDAADPAARVASVPAWAAVRPGWYAGTFVPWLATRGAPALYPVIRTVLAEALAQRAARPATLGYVLRRWEGMGGGGDTPEVARRLRGAMAWHAGAWVLLLAGGFVFLMLLLTIL
jgi:hypothetical protein